MKNIKRRALVLGVGGFRGSYDAGVLVELLQVFGPDYFQEVFTVSVGTYNGSLYVAGQAEVMEDVWKNHVHGNLMLNYFNFLRGRPILSIDYLTGVFQSPGTALDISKLLRSTTKIWYSVTDAITTEPSYMLPEPGLVFRQMQASSALPLIHGPVWLHGKLYADWATIRMPLPLERALAGNFDEIIAVYNKPYGSHLWEKDKSPELSFLRHITPILPKYCAPLGWPQEKLNQGLNRVEEIFSSRREVLVIRPQKELPLQSFLDTNREHLVSSFEIGREDGKRFIQNYTQ